jgi:hypothetical protein
MAIAEFDDVDVSNAMFALGRFIDYRLEEGMEESWLFPYMQSFLNLSYRVLEPPDLHELRARTTFDGQENPEEVNQWSPAWLPYGEKLLCHRRLHGIDQSTFDPGAPTQISAVSAPVLASS